MFLKLLVSMCAILMSAYVLPGILVMNIWTALWLAIFLAVINITLKPVLIIFTLPINILTIGLFTFVINACLILLASSVIKGFEVASFWEAFLFSIIMSIFAFILHKITGSK